jgi:integrase
VTDRSKAFHSFRHSFADGLRATGLSTEGLKILLGHSDGATTPDAEPKGARQTEAERDPPHTAWRRFHLGSLERSPGRFCVRATVAMR